MSPKHKWLHKALHLKTELLLPMARVMTLNLCRISLTTSLFWSGVTLQQSTARQCLQSSTNWSTSSSDIAMLKVGPSITSPMLGSTDDPVNVELRPLNCGFIPALRLASPSVSSNLILHTDCNNKQDVVTMFWLGLLIFMSSCISTPLTSQPSLQYFLLLLL